MIQKTDRLTEICTQVESAIRQHASSQRKVAYRKKAKQFVSVHQIKHPPVSFSHQMYDTGRHKKKQQSGIYGFIGSRLPRSAVPTPTTRFKYVTSPRSPRIRPNTSLMIQQLPQRPSTRSSTRPYNPRNNRPATAFSHSNITNSKPEFMVTNDNEIFKCNTKKETKKETEAERQKELRREQQVLSIERDRDDIFRQHFRTVQLQVYDRFVVQGIKKEHRKPRTTTPRSPRWKGSSSDQQNVVEVSMHTAPSTGAQHVRGKKKRRKKKKEKKPTMSMRVTIKVTKPKKTRMRGSTKFQERQRLQQQQDEEQQRLDLEEQASMNVGELVAEPWENDKVFI